MSDFFYIASLFIACAYFIIQQTRLFNKGKYNPYLFMGEERNIKQIIIDIVFIIVINLSLQHIANPLFIQLFLIALSLCVNILNYLSYVKIKDRKIIYRTAIFDIIVIVLCLLILKLQIKVSP